MYIHVNSIYNTHISVALSTVVHKNDKYRELIQHTDIQQTEIQHTTNRVHKSTKIIHVQTLCIVNSQYTCTCKYSSQPCPERMFWWQQSSTPPQSLFWSWHCWYRVWPRPDQTGSQTWDHTPPHWDQPGPQECRKQGDMVHEEQIVHEEDSKREREKYR